MKSDGKCEEHGLGTAMEYGIFEMVPREKGDEFHRSRFGGIILIKRKKVAASTS